MIASLGLLVMAAPLLWMALSAFKTKRDLTASPPVWLPCPLARGLRPVVTLHHFTVPQWLQPGLLQRPFRTGGFRSRVRPLLGKERFSI